MERLADELAQKEVNEYLKLDRDTDRYELFYKNRDKWRGCREVAQMYQTKKKEHLDRMITVKKLEILASHKGTIFSLFGLGGIISQIEIKPEESSEE